MPRSRRLAASALVAAASLAAAGVVRAQGEASMPGTSPLDLNVIQNATLGAHIGNLSLGAGGGRSGASARALSDDALRFRRDPAVSRRVRSQVASGASAGGAFRTMALRTAVTGGAMDTEYAKLAAKYGARADDAGDAVAFYLTSLWLRANDPAREPTAAELRGVRTQVRGALAANPNSPVLTDEAARQTLGEGMALRMMLAEYAVAPVIQKGDPAGLERVRDDAAAEGRRALGLDLRTLRLTDRGLVGPGGNGARTSAAAAPASPAADAPRAVASASGDRAAVDGASVDRAPAGPVAHVVLRFTVTAGVAGGTSADFNPSILYRDGRAVDPDDRSADGRGRWRQEGPRAVSVVWESGRRSQWDKIGEGSYFYARCGAPAGGLSGTYRSLTGGGTAEVTAFAARDLTFRPDGTFALDASGGGFSASSAASVRRQTGGRYQVDGWTITFTYPDGHTERGLFYRFPNSDGTIGVGGPGGVRTYSRDR